MSFNLFAESTVAGRFRLMTDWLTKHLDLNLLPPPEILGILEGMRAQPYTKHAEVIADYNKTQKHLISQFRKFGGLSPKAFHQIFRFNAILAEIREQKLIDWTDIAYQTGFADQSHFVRAFKEFSGINPTEFISRGFNEQETNFFPLDRG